MSNQADKMSNPYVVEEQILKLLKDRLNWLTNDDDELTGMSLSDFEAEMKTRYKRLMDSSETLFKKALAGDFDQPQNVNKLLEMLAMMKKVYHNKIDKYQADVAMGQRYANEYLNPLMSKLNKDKNGKK